jgi:hypothetical protein
VYIQKKERMGLFYVDYTLKERAQSLRASSTGKWQRQGAEKKKKEKTRNM